MGAEQGQFPLVRAAEVGRDARRQADGVEPYEKGAALLRIAVQLPEQFEGAVPYGAQMGRRPLRGGARSGGEAQPFAQGPYRPFAADRLQGVQGLGRCRGQQGDHGLFGVLVAQFADRFEERSGCGGGRKQPCDRVPDREVAGPLSGQGDQQGEPPWPARIVGRCVGEYPERLLAGGEEDRRHVAGRNRVVGQGQADDGGDVPAVREVPAPVETAQAGHGRAAEQQGVARGDGRQRADVVAVRQIAEEFQPAPAEARREAGVLDGPAQQVPVAVARGGREGGLGHLGPHPQRDGGNGGRVASGGTGRSRDGGTGREEPCEEAGRQRVRRRPGLGEFAQRTGDDRGAVGSQQPDQVLPDQRGGQHSAVQPLPGQPYRLGLEHRIAAGHQLVHEPRRPVRSGDVRPSHRLVEEFARFLLTERGGIVQQIGPQPGDPYGRRQLPGRAPRRPGRPLRWWPSRS